VVNSEPGEKERVKLPRKIHPWYFNSDGSYFICIKYGNRTLEFAKGKNSIEVGDKKNLLSVIGTLIEAVLSRPQRK